MNYRTKTKRRVSLAFLTAALGVLSLAAVALADTLNVNDLSVTGDATKTVGQTGTAKFSLTAANGDGKNGCNATGQADAVTFNVSSSNTAAVTLDASTVTIIGCGTDFTVGYNAVGVGDATISASYASGGGSGVQQASAYNVSDTLVVHVGAAQGQNHKPVVDTAAADANGTEGDTLSSSGKFTDEDGDTMTLTADETEGTFTDNGDGTWSWSLPTNDDVAGGTITVTADDGNGGTETDSFEYSAANADPQIGTLTFGGNCQASLSFSISDVGTADTHSGTIDWGDGSSEPFTGSSVSNLSHTYGHVGSYTVLVDAEDDDGGQAQQQSGQATVEPSLSAVQQPINASGTRSSFKNGSTIPVKVKVLDCDGTAISGAGYSRPTIKVEKLDSVGNPVNEAVISSTSAADTGNQMRWDAGGNQFIYNLATKSLGGEGTYRLTVTPGGDYTGGAQLVTFDVKK